MNRARRTSEWGDRRGRELVQRVGRFLRGLEDQPALRQRLARWGYDEQQHRRLQAGLARAGDLRAARLLQGAAATAARRRITPTSAAALSRWGGPARALLGWATEQARLAAGATGKLPAVAREVRKVAREASERAPVDTLQSTWHLVQRLRGDEHLGHFLTPGGLRDAGLELRQRLHEGGSAQARGARRQALAELSFVYLRWRRIALEEFGEEPSACAALGLDDERPSK
jgi:hypothetical protein